MRKHRAARRVMADPVRHAMQSVALLPAESIQVVKSGLAQALERFTAGRDCRLHWMTMADALNVAESLANLRICGDDGSRQIIERGMAVLAAVWERHLHRESWTLRYCEEHQTHERELLDLALWMHGVQLEHCTFREYEQAIEMTANRVRGALAGSPGSGTKVVGAIR